MGQVAHEEAQGMARRQLAERLAEWHGRGRLGRMPPAPLEMAGMQLLQPFVQAIHGRYVPA